MNFVHEQPARELYNDRRSHTKMMMINLIWRSREKAAVWPSSCIYVGEHPTSCKVVRGDVWLPSPLVGCVWVVALRSPFGFSLGDELQLLFFPPHSFCFLTCPCMCCFCLVECAWNPSKNSPPLKIQEETFFSPLVDNPVQEYRG